jgi:hypothetical protein
MAGFDAETYSTVPTQNAALTIALARRLIQQMPASVAADPAVAVAANRMRSRAAALRTERLKQLEQTAAVDKRPFDQAEDNAWRALYGRLVPYVDVGVAGAPEAATLLQSVFPKGLTFSTLKYPEQWEESERLLQRIDQQGLATQLDQLSGPAFLAAVRAAHQAFGAALGLTQPTAPPPAAAAIAETLRALRDAIRFYSRRVVALADEEAPATVTVVEAALAPLREAQAALRQRRARGEPDPEPADEGELPPLPIF